MGRFIPRFSVEPRYKGSSKKARKAKTEQAGEGVAVEERKSK